MEEGNHNNVPYGLGRSAVFHFGLSFGNNMMKYRMNFRKLNWPGCLFGVYMIFGGWLIGYVIAFPWQVFPQMIMLLGIVINIMFIGLAITKKSKTGNPGKTKA